jgi:NDP-4-keto-2,6-dideoxyhexose 3-C-methyltransferase
MSSDGYTTRITCRICGGKDFVTVLDMGSQYIAGQFVTDTARDALLKPYPLELVRCASADGCGLVQLRHSVDPQLMYIDYGYQSGINQTMRNNLKDIADRVRDEAALKSGDLVLDIGCNDGTLLSSYPKGFRTVGFDPSENVAKLAQSKGHQVINDFFSADRFAKEFPNQKAKAVTSIAMFYDLEDPQAFASVGA